MNAPKAECQHGNTTIGETMPSMYRRCLDCHKEMEIGLLDVPREKIDATLTRFAEYMQKFDRADGEDISTTPRGVLVHGVVKDSDTGLPIILASFQMMVAIKP